MQLIEKNLKTPHLDLTLIRSLVADDMAAVNRIILTELNSQVEMINEITLHLVQSGGKRLRPLLVLLVARALNYTGDSEHHELAAIIEFIHTATLLHDDVVDASDRRRNQPTANAIWGNQESVLAGDFLYSRAFQILARRSNIPVMKVLADTTNQIAEGEVLQLINRGQEVSEAEYFKVIQRKTAQLYSAAAEIAAIIAPNSKYRETAAQFGLHLGLAFQMIDDLLDYIADAQNTGKNIGDDLAEGKVTLPLIYTLHHGTEAQKQVIHQAIKNCEREQINSVIEAITAANGWEYTFNYAKQSAKKAQEYLLIFPPSIYRDALTEICEFVLQRDF